MIARKCKSHHGTNLGLAIHDDNAIRNTANSEDGGLRRQDDRLEGIDVVHAEVRDRESSASDVRRFQPAASGALGEFFDEFGYIGLVRCVCIGNYSTTHVDR